MDLLSGIDEFLDQVTVLPPGEWDPTIRIEPPKNVPSQVSGHGLLQDYFREFFILFFLNRINSNALMYRINLERSV